MGAADDVERAQTTALARSAVRQPGGGRPTPDRSPTCGRCGSPTARWPTGWFLCPLRLFLGVTFLFAGLQKLANPQFFKTLSPTSIHAQLLGTSTPAPSTA